MFDKDVVSKSLGYQISQNMFDQYPINNAGDPFGMKNFYKIHTHKEERELVMFYGEVILKMRNVWGYCAPGSTEAILNALWIARKRFPANTPIFASEECHFCVPKIADMLCMPIVFIPTEADTGCMNMLHLKQYIEDNRISHAIVVCTMGTTIRNGYDDISSLYKDVVERLSPGVQFHVHADGAFGGAIYPFVKPEWLNYRIDSFNVSLHKFLGAPTPCSLFLTSKDIINDIKGKGCFGKEMVCLPAKDFTVSCSRNGAIVSLMHRMILNRMFVETTKTNIQRCRDVRAFFINLLSERRVSHRCIDDGLSLSVEIMDIPIECKDKLDPYGITVRNQTQVGFDTHVFVCTHTTEALLLEFVNIIT